MRVIIIECEKEELDSVIKRFHLMDPHNNDTIFFSKHEEDHADRENPVNTNAPLTDEERKTLSMIWRRLKPGAQEVLAEIAKKPEEFPFDELDTQMRRKHPAWKPKLRTGYMSSIGHQWEPYRHRGIPTLLDRNWYRRTFTMDPRVAELIKELTSSAQQTRLQ